jgi:hypothetical protein
MSTCLDKNYVQYRSPIGATIAAKFVKRTKTLRGYVTTLSAKVTKQARFFEELLCLITGRVDQPTSVGRGMPVLESMG